MIGLKILKAIDMCFYIYMLMICVRCLLTWIPSLDWKNNKFLYLLKSSVDLYLDLFRKFIPPLGPFDFSPIIAMFALIFLNRIVLYTCVKLFLMIGLIS